MKNIPSEIEALLFHEMAHCLFDKDHTDELEIDIMNPYGIDSWDYLKWYNREMNKLFDCKKNCPKVDFEVGRYDYGN